MPVTTVLRAADSARSGAPDNRAAQDDTLQLFERYGQAIFRFCRSLSLTSADAEDVVQNTFLKLLQHLAANGDRSNLRAWLFTVAANECRNRVRMRRRWFPWRAELDTRAVGASQDAGLADAVATFRRLSQRDRQLLTLRAEGCSYREIASVTGIRPQSVGQLLSRALARWKRELSNADGRPRV